MDHADGMYDRELKMTNRMMIFYYISLAVLIVVALMEVRYGNVGDLLITLPVILILAVTIFTDRDIVHIPPAFVVLLVGTFLLSLIGRTLIEGNIIDFIAQILAGINLTIIGLIFVFVLLKSMPGVRDENPRMVAIASSSMAIAIFVMMRMVQYFVSTFGRSDPVELDILMYELVCVIIGTVLVSCMYNIDRTRVLFEYTLNSFLESNSDALGLEEREREDVQRLISKGESEKLEFKSTLRLNLQTGEQDKRMEKAVLKTIVAFLNSDGGTLLVGVVDDGSIRGIDMESFENRDKLNLHLTNLISSTIGNRFLPYISFNLVDFDDERSVMKVKCDPCEEPVFLKDGKVEIFYVRSGPSSVELTGMNLIEYVGNRMKTNGGKRFLRKRG